MDASICETQQIAIKEHCNDLLSQMSNKSNPLVIYHFYDKFVTILDLNLDLNPSNIWNCNESGFPINLDKSKVIALDNKPGFKLSYGVHSKSTTTLAVSNGTETVSINHFPWQKLSVFVAWRSVNSWIQTDVLADWFDVFADKNKGSSMKIKVTHFVTHVENL